ncbi:hypothetical protein ACLOJK_021034 [Asimina triloba]
MCTKTQVFSCSGPWVPGSVTVRPVALLGSRELRHYSLLEQNFEPSLSYMRANNAVLCSPLLFQRECLTKESDSFNHLEKVKKRNSHFLLSDTWTGNMTAHCVSEW